MTVCYNKLWKLLIDKDLKKKDLQGITGIASSTITKMTKNKYVSLEVLERICKHLNCNIDDIIEINCEDGE